MRHTTRGLTRLRYDTRQRSEDWDVGPWWPVDAALHCKQSFPASFSDQVHAFYMLQMLMSDKLVGPEMHLFTSECMILALDGFSSPVSL